MLDIIVYMGASPSSIGKSNKLSKVEKVSKTNEFINGNSPFVCRWWASLLSCCSFPSYFFIFLGFLYWTAFSSFFLVASEPILLVPTNTSTTSTTNEALASPPTTPLYNSTRTGVDIFVTHKHKNTFFHHKLVVATSVVLCFLLFVFFCIMALFKCFGYKLKRHGRVLDHAKVSIVVEGEKDEYGSCLKRFTCDEVEKFTMNLSRSRLIAYGGFSAVYLAQFPDSMLGAVKIMDLSSERFQRVYRQELEILLQVQHDNIVKFLGNCDNGEEGMLVFEYVPNGTLQEKLHGVDARKLSWKNRMAIAFQLAKAIEYLHDKCPLPIVHGDIKASNVLLDKKFNCKLCDFGSAKMGFSSTILPPSSSNNRMMMLGSPGYTDPHYLRTGIASKKNDIYSFGVIILELISGLEALSCDSGERVISKAGNILRDASKVAEIMDPKLNGDYDLEEAKAMVSLAGLCLGDSPSLRPSASEILDAMTSRISSITFQFSPDKKV